MKLAILGSGLMGSKLGHIFAQAGHDIVFSYARTRDKLERLAKKAGPRAKAASPAEAVRDADVLILAVHWSRIPDVLKQTGSLAGKLMISCSLPMNLANTELVIGQRRSGAEALAKRIPKAKVVSAFNTIPSEVLHGVYKARRKKPLPSLVLCGDDKKAKAIAAKLIRDVGFDPIDAGPLRMARFTEPFALLVAQLAYETGQSPDLAYAFKHYRS